MTKTLLLVGLDPGVVDFSDPALAASNLDAAKLQAGLDAAEAELKALGYDASWVLTDRGETAEATVRARLTEAPCDCVLVGGGIRLIPAHFLLFEKLINVIHEHAAQARIAFNTNPADTAEAVRRWL